MQRFDVAGSPAEDATWKQVFDAMAMCIVTPSYSYVTLKIDALKGGPETSEMINTGKASFLKSAGKWKAGVSSQAMLDQMNENRKDTKSACHFVRDEAIDGAIDSQVWLARRTDCRFTSNWKWMGRTAKPVTSLAM